MVLFDSSYLIRVLDPRAGDASDRNGNPVLDTQARLSRLLSQLALNDSQICVPTPVIAEVMVLSSNGGSAYLAEMRRSARFILAPFDMMAAVEAWSLIAIMKREKPALPNSTWAKVKFDCQIAAIAKSRGVDSIFSDDRDIAAHGRRLNIPVTRICDLPVPTAALPAHLASDLFSHLTD